MVLIQNWAGSPDYMSKSHVSRGRINDGTVMALRRDDR